AADRYDLIAALRARERWDPFRPEVMVRPALITDRDSGQRYVRAGDLATHFRHQGVAFTPREFPGRMTMIGLRRATINGRESMPLEGTRRRTNHTPLYRVPAQEGSSDG